MDTSTLITILMVGNILLLIGFGSWIPSFDKGARDSDQDILVRVFRLFATIAADIVLISMMFAIPRHYLLVTTSNDVFATVFLSFGAIFQVIFIFASGYVIVRALWCVILKKV